MSVFHIAKQQLNKSKTGPIPFQVVLIPPFVFDVCAFRTCRLRICYAAPAFLESKKGHLHVFWLYLSDEDKPYFNFWLNRGNDGNKQVIMLLDRR